MGTRLVPRAEWRLLSIWEIQSHLLVRRTGNVTAQRWERIANVQNAQRVECKGEVIQDGPGQEGQGEVMRELREGERVEGWWERGTGPRGWVSPFVWGETKEAETVKVRKRSKVTRQTWWGQCWAKVRELELEAERKRVSQEGRNTPQY